MENEKKRKIKLMIIILYNIISIPIQSDSLRTFVFFFKYDLWSIKINLKTLRLYF